MTKLRNVAWGCVLAIGFGGLLAPLGGRAGGADDPPRPAIGPTTKAPTTAAAKPETPAAPAAPSSPKFMRIRRGERNEPVAFETPVVRYAADSPQRPGVVVDLIGAVHVGDKAYYDELNKLFTEYDAVLYELVAPEGTRIPKEGRPTGNGHPVGALQNGLKSMLDLEHQLDRVDYTAANLIHADMSPDEFAQRMKDRNDGWLQMALRMMGQSAAQQGQQAAKQGKDDAVAPEMQILLAFFAKDRTVRLKRAMAETLAQSEGGLAALEGPDGGSTIVSERNKKALEVLTRELGKGKKKIAIFYGAAHLPDFEKRLVGEFGLKRGDERWLVAWSLRTGK